MPNRDFSENEGNPISHLFDVMDGLINKIRGSDNVTFLPESKIYLSPESTNMPCISYNIKQRNVSEKVSGVKPVFKEKIPEEGVVIKSQIFDVFVDFSIWSRSSYSLINEEREWFEEFMIIHLDEFKKEGMLMVLFREQLEDDVVNIKDNYFIKQTLRYLVRNERMFKIPFENIKEINLEVNRFSQNSRLNNIQKI